MNRRILSFAAVAFSAVFAFSCAEKDGDRTPVEPYYLEFINEADSLQEFTPDFQGTYELELNTNVPRNFLKVNSVDSQVWCSADLDKAGNTILITPGMASDSVLEARFVVEIVGGGQSVDPIEFTVRRLYQEVEHTLTVSREGVSLEGVYPIVEVSGAAQTLTFTVETTASLWKVNYDYFSDDQEWFAVDKASGRSGETLTLTLDRNDTGVSRNQNFTFAPSFAGTDVAVNVTLIQKVWSAIERVTVKSFNRTSLAVGEEIPNNVEVTLASGNTAASPYCFVVEILGEGGVEVKFAEPWSNEFSYEAPGEWMFGGSRDIDPENADAGKYFYITTVGNSGPARSMDAVLTDASGVELFRFHFTQSAAPSY